MAWGASQGFLFQSESQLCVGQRDVVVQATSSDQPATVKAKCRPDELESHH